MSIEKIKNKDGSISIRVRVSDGYKTDKHGNSTQVRIGKTLHFPKGTGIRKALAEAKQLELKLQSQLQHQQITASTMKLDELYNWYKQYYAVNTLRSSTLSSIKNIYEKHISPKMGHIKIDEITSSRVTFFLNEFCEKKNPKTGKPYNPPKYYKDSYTRTVLTVLSRILNVAIKQGWIKDNPCTNAILPKRNRRIKLPPLEIYQIKDILSKTEIFTVHNAIIRFQIYTGMRIGETLALTWKDISFDKMTITINKTVYYSGQGFEIGPPKTDNGYRILGMSNTIRDLLLEVKKEQDNRKLFLKNIYTDQDLVFSSDTGGYIIRNNINARLNSIKKGTDYEYINVHFLRHANATLLLYHGVDLKTISSHLGHSDIGVTADIYADVLSSTKQRVAQIIEFELDSENSEEN